MTRGFSHLRVPVAIAVAAAALCGALLRAAEVPTIHLAVRPQAETKGVLAATDFYVRVNGTEAPVLNEKTPRDGQMILVVLDLAEDIANAQAAKDALVDEVRKLPASVLVALIRAQDGPVVLVDPTADRAAIASAIQASPVTGKAGLLDSLSSVEALATSISKASHARVATLYITDSSAGNYREDFANPVINSSDSHDLSRRFPEALIGEKIDQMEQEIAAREVPLFIVHLRYSTSTLNAAYQSGLKRLAEETAGWSAFCASTAEIPDAIRQSFSAISSQYLLTVGLPAPTPSAVRIQVDTRSKDESYGEVVYRPRLVLK